VNSLPYCCPYFGFRIFSDSLSALQAFLHFDTRSRRLIHEIVHVYTTLVRGGTFIRLVWVPSHVGLFGNELADRAATAALHSKEDVMVPHSVGEIDCLVKRHIMSQWQLRWEQSTHGRYFFGIKPRVSREMSIFGKTRRDQVIYARLRLGQCNLKARLHMIAGHPTGLCDCGVPETVHHYLFGCFRYIVQRAILFRAFDALQLGRGPLVLNELRAVPAILNFVRSTGKYNTL